MSIKSFILQLGKYGLFGIITTLIHLFVAWFVLYTLSVSVFFANSMAFFTAFIFSYIFQTLYVFESEFKIVKFLKFFIVQFGTFLLSFTSSNFVHIENQYLHTLLIVAIMPLISFVIHKFWTFK